MATVLASGLKTALKPVCPLPGIVVTDGPAIFQNLTVVSALRAEGDGFDLAVEFQGPDQTTIRFPDTDKSGPFRRRPPEDSRDGQLHR